MATNTNKYNIDLLLECALCHCDLTTNNNPKSLPCLHTFCTPCLTKNGGQNFIKKERGRKICPVCFNLPSENSEITNNLELDTITERLLRVRDLQQSKHNCGMCAEEDILSTSTNWCVDCQKFLCDSCLLPHGKFRPKDKVIDIVSQGSNYKVSDFISPTKCPRHGKKFETYCTNCTKCLCVSCLFEHRSVIYGKQCVLVPIGGDASDKKSQGLSLLEKMNSHLETVQKQIAEMKLEISELEMQHSKKKVEIWDHVEETVKQLKDNARAVINEMEAVTKSDVGELEKLIQLKQNHIKEIEILDINFYQLLHKFDIVDILSNYSRFESKCNTILRKPNDKRASKIVMVQYNDWYLDILKTLKTKVPLARYWKGGYERGGGGMGLDRFEALMDAGHTLRANGHLVSYMRNKAVNQGYDQYVDSRKLQSPFYLRSNFGPKKH